MQKNIDIIEQNILEYNSYLLDTLLKDHTTGNNIRWATNDYEHLGEFYSAKDEIKPILITGKNTKIIQPRASKSNKEQEKRTKDKAEVFTPSWICNSQNNLVDEAWFGRKDVFNHPKNGGDESKGWEPVAEKIIFPNERGKTWQDYVDARRMEIACGEAPYLVSRYDTVSGEPIDVMSRIGLLDRKLRIIGENTTDYDSWMKWTIRAYESIYGFDYQGDNILLARENLLYTFIDYYVDKFGKEPTLQDVKKIATVISWNIWQMNGISMTAPYSERAEAEQIMFSIDNLLAESYDDENLYYAEDNKNESPCVIMDWRSKVKVEYKSMLKGDANGR